ncbi:Nuclear speckle splicing regulatory protein like [Quillaja saponaria]|uniref:Nuclear speckle splicing regulatory protein like n=1 Tax=Quillaja saponaria TaxID=32244 RepID=A0AAD7KU17_QUISA|nr:Nuclear speckle splicing regulatory protein like [Quillaja saponaria]
MVSKVEETLKRTRRQQQPQQQQQQLQKQIFQCNKGKVCKFKRSSSNLEEDGVSSAILLLACIACAPSYA